MGKIYGSNRIIGTVGKVRHYKMNGGEEIYVAESGGANKNLILNNPAFAMTRMHMAEMTPRSQLASQVKRKLGMWSIPIVNRYLIGSINAALRVAQKRDNGEIGCRSIYLSRCRDVLNIPIYYWYKPLRDIMKCPYSVETSLDRKSVTVTIENLIPREQIKPPIEATHFQFCVCLGVVCDIVYNTVNKDFSSVYGGNFETHSMKEFESEWIPINAGAMGDVSFTVKLPEDYVLEEDMTVLQTFGVVFGKMITNVEPLKRNTGSIEFLGAV